MINKICEHCGSGFQVINSRKNAKFCCRKCSDESKKGNPNVQCSYCGKEFHIKMYQIERYKRTMGFFCSRQCQNEFRKTWFCDENNHQYGLKGELNSSFKGKTITHKNHNIIDTYVYKPNHPFANKDGRVLRHHLIVEQNSDRFDKKFFIEIDNNLYLNKYYSVHHKDNNHGNDSIENLEILTRSQHTAIHNKNRKIVRDNNGRIVNVLDLVDELSGSNRGVGGFGSTGK